ncbi:MAG: hypothetical protein IPN34_17400 [Planctomycetes bacterium]|nr:hypothetical protein [Planctomycetota bacterium]
MHRVTERDLADFRREYLHPRALLAEVERRVHLLLKIPLGVGKSYAADKLLLDPATYERFQLVIYLAPSWDVINERAIVSGKVQSPVRHMILRPRPEHRCGPVRDLWKELEAAGCISLAKQELCGPCPRQRDEGDPCTWPKRFNDFEGTRLVFATEQQLRLNRRLLPTLLYLSGKGRALVILDEGVFLDGSFEVEVTRQDLEQLRDALATAILERPQHIVIAHEWEEHVKQLLAVDDDDLRQERFAFSPRLPYVAAAVQRRGVGLFGDRFRFRGYELLGLPFSKAEERWIDAKTGALHFISRPYLRHHILLLSAHLDADYVGHRLGTTRIHSPFAKLRVEHTQTKAWNLRSWMGSDRRFSKDPRHLLDVFAVIVLRNIREGRSTVLVSRKKSKAVVASHLEKRLAG